MRHRYQKWEGISRLAAMMLYLVFILVLAFWFAKVEIQIEGPSGWGKNLPTWRIEKHWLLDVFWGGRAMTGYHFWVIPFIFLLFHLPVFVTGEWSWQREGRIFGGFVLFWIFEDFLWFVINPAFGIQKFKPEWIPWHPRWFAKMPVDYWLFFPLGFGLVWISF